MFTGKRQSVRSRVGFQNNAFVSIRRSRSSRCRRNDRWRKPRSRESCLNGRRERASRTSRQNANYGNCNEEEGTNCETPEYQLMDRYQYLLILTYHIRRPDLAPLRNPMNPKRSDSGTWILLAVEQCGTISMTQAVHLSQPVVNATSTTLKKLRANHLVSRSREIS